MTKYFGLTSSEVIENQKKFGPNILEKKKKLPLFFHFLKKISNPFLLMLLFSSLLSISLGQKTDFFVILTILLVSIILDIFQERQAQNAAEKLAQKISLSVQVIRNGKKILVNVSEITVGDIVVLSVGNIIPADCQLLESQNLEVNQAVLTGESFPVEKEKDDSILMGTHVVSGFAIAKVTSIGRSTQFGKISSTLSKPRPQTEFEKGLNNFSFLLLRITFIFAVILFVVNLILGHELISSLMFVLALIIGFAPELLPVILTINLAKGSLRLSKKGVIIKFLPAIENFGSMDILCTDKTGTLTQGVMSLESSLNILGKKDKKVIANAFLNSFYQVGFKNPIDDAILDQKINLPVKFKKLGEISYNFYRRRSSVFLQKDDSCLLIVKGAINTVLPLCFNRKKIKIDFDALNKKGLRTIVIATKKLKIKSKYTASDEKNLTCLGVLAFADPPKIDVLETINHLEKLGINLKILTGDSELVTLNICQKIGLTVKNILIGSQIEKLTDSNLAKMVDDTTIFASINPDQKLRIINALQQKGHTVGFLGDGINDAPSLKNADVGISVNNAVDIAKESADLILLCKDLKVLRIGIEEGRTTFANIMKYIFMGTSSTFGNMLSLSFASLILSFLPLLPVQLLLNDLLYDFSQMLLVKDNVDISVVHKPYSWNIKSIGRFMLVFGSISSIFDLLTFYILSTILKASPSMFQTGWFMESFLTQTIIIFSIRTSLVPFWKSKINPTFAFGILVIGLIGLYLPYSFLSPYFHFNPPPSIFFILLILIIVNYFYFIELAKSYFYKINHQKKMKINVLVKTNAKKESIEKIDENNYKISVAASPVNGKANEAIIKNLAKYFDVSKSALSIKSGLKTKRKVIDFTPHTDL